MTIEYSISEQNEIPISNFLMKHKGGPSKLDKTKMLRIALCWKHVDTVLIIFISLMLVF